jgi:hypothetical protein
MRCENRRRRQDFIEVLELLSRPLLIRIGDCLVVYVCDVWEPVNDESAHHACLGHFILLDIDCCQIRQSLQF